MRRTHTHRTRHGRREGAAGCNRESEKTFCHFHRLFTARPPPPKRIYTNGALPRASRPITYDLTGHVCGGGAARLRLHRHPACCLRSTEYTRPRSARRAQLRSQRVRRVRTDDGFLGFLAPGELGVGGRIELESARLRHWHVRRVAIVAALPCERRENRKVAVDARVRWRRRRRRGRRRVARGGRGLAASPRKLKGGVAVALARWYWRGPSRSGG